MKENKMMRVVFSLLVAVLLTTCAISGTFAKYVTSGSNSGSARVAKFGVTVSGTADVFKKTYAKDGQSVTLNADTVVSTEDVVAPGTSGSMAKFTITGVPEVAVRVEFAGKLELGNNWVDSNSAYYCPIEITVGKETVKGLSYKSADDFEKAVNAEIAKYTQDYEAGTDLSKVYANDTATDSANTDDSTNIYALAPTISWAWAFNNDDEKDTDLDDEKDTDLGNQADPSKVANISLSVTATVTQID